ncbi:MAG: sensor domain-containing diguanylate cyclase [Elusimicrobia bacterium]|nr:sensor domain-containing diguanylate cyclase [Elusimicrobiota bacterium]
MENRQLTRPDRVMAPAQFEERVFCIFLVALAITYRHNPLWIYPQILWALSGFLIWNLCYHRLLNRLIIEGAQKTAVFLINTILITTILRFSGGPDSLLWPLYLLPIFGCCLILSKRELGFLSLLQCLAIIWLHFSRPSFTDAASLLGLGIKTGTLFFAFLAIGKLVLNRHETNQAPAPPPLVETNVLLDQVKDERDILNQIMKEIRRVMGVEASSLILLDPTDQELYFQAVSGGKTGVREIRLQLGEGIAGWVAKYGKPVMINDVRKDKRFTSRVDQSTGYVTRNLLCAALKVDNKTLGVIEAINKRHGNFTDADLRTFCAFAAQAAIAIENVRLYSIAFIDSLTGTYGRRYLESWLEKEMARTQRYGGDFSFAILDLDHFKAVNDRYGHIAGDYVLAEVAKVAKASIRSSDILARYGGEEFALIFPNTPLEQAIAVAERIRLAIAQHAFIFEGQTLTLSGSVGLASFKTCRPNIYGDMMKLADEALYRAKKIGRNQLVLANPVT